MKKELKASFLIFAATALLCAGCAKQEVIKQDQMIPPAAPAASKVAPAQKVETAVAAPESRKAALPASTIHESQANSQNQANASKQGASILPALEKIYFDFDSYALSSQARDALAKNAEIMKQKDNVKIQVEGHCDELGSDDYNLALGERRANAAMNYLKSLGVPGSRLSAISFGKEKPADPGHDEAARAKNRRGEFVIKAAN